MSVHFLKTKNAYFPQIKIATTHEPVTFSKNRQQKFIPEIKRILEARNTFTITLISFEKKTHKFSKPKRKKLKYR